MGPRLVTQCVSPQGRYADGWYLSVGKSPSAVKSSMTSASLALENQLLGCFTQDERDQTVRAVRRAAPHALVTANRKLNFLAHVLPLSNRNTLARTCYISALRKGAISLATWAGLKVCLH